MVTYLQREKKGKYAMVYIDRQGDLVGIEGSVEELSENVATLYTTILRHVIEEGRNTNERVGYMVVEVLTEAMLRTVMEMVEDEKSIESIISACKTIGETGHIDMKQYKISDRWGITN